MHAFIAEMKAAIGSSITRVTISGPSELFTSDETAAYTFSIRNVPADTFALTVTFRVEDDYFYGRGMQGLNGWSIVKEDNWVPDSDDFWLKSITLARLGGGNAEDGDFLKAVLENRLIAEGSTMVEITGVTAATPGKLIDISYGKPAVTTVVLLSVYDVNQDGKVDLADVAAAAYFFAWKAGDAGWGDEVAFQTNDPGRPELFVSPKRADVNRDGEVDIEDLILIFANFQP
jgi:uncharacterized Zn-binding protein involved in type VI secretion